MDECLERILDLTAIARDEMTLKTALTEIAERYDFTGYAFVSLRPGHSYAASDYDTTWQERYHKDELRFVDPVIRQAQRYRRAFAWSGENEKSSLSVEERRFFSDAADYNIRSGITMPIATPNGAVSMLTLASSKPQLTPERHIDAIAAASAVGQLHALMEQLQVTPTIEEKIYLSPKEATFVRWITLGKSMEDIALLEGVKYNTVRIALSDVRHRYGLCNNYELIGLALRRGLV
ncbi:transcriptional regulator TraR [Rhizobium sp. AAP43]|uniref:autoinducer-binding transcriptional regulator TraR n=1 Tax=Rhizobium sp. AAP43 TaxID=1523420 RepID=UPI0006BA0C9B|nr:transcriptional regulator TraR [Rhizobium sp. AAP43]KPF42609.1 transcriptional regulator TraR [Rhizobium sp. AAP43]